MHVQNLAVSTEPYFEVLNLNISHKLRKIDKLSGSLCLNKLKFDSECEGNLKSLVSFRTKR